MGKRQGRGGGGNRDKRHRGDGEGGRGHGGGGRGGRGGRGGGGTGWDARSSWPAAEKTCPAMESYYQKQEIVPDEEWLDFLAACRKLSKRDCSVCLVVIMLSWSCVYLALVAGS